MPKRITKNEKTDFIVNMTKDGFMKLALIFLAAACVGVGIAYLPYYLKRGNSFMSGESDSFIEGAVLGSQAAEYIKYAVLILMAFGFFGFLILLISASKKYLRLKESGPFVLLFGYALMCAVSTAVAVDRSVALFGSEGRYEGLISVLAYAGLFCAASQLTDKNARKKLVGVICAVGAVHAVVGIFQASEPVSEIFPSFFTENYVINGSVSENYIANGFMTSPYALAALLTVTTAISLGGLMYEEKASLKIFFAATGVLSALGGLLTKNVSVLAGFATVIIALGIIEIVRIKTGHGLFVKSFLKNPLGVLFLSAVVLGAGFAALYATGIFTFEDAYIVLQDSFYRINSANPVYSAKGVEVYSYLWQEVGGIFKNNFVFGTGLDCIAASKYPAPLEYSGSADRAYNEYLTMAASTGAASLLFYLGFVASCIKRGINGVGKFFDLKDNWVRAAALAGCAGYLVQGVFSSRSVSSTGIFFVLLGLCFSKTEE